MSRNDILNTIVKFFNLKKDEFSINRMGVFGSVARNELTNNSDIDVVVELDKPDLFKLIGIKQELEELLHCSVDVVRYREKMNSYLKKQIEQEAIYV